MTPIVTSSDPRTFCSPEMIKVTNAASIMHAMLVTCPRPGGYIKIKLRPEIRKQEPDSMPMMMDRAEFLAIVLRCRDGQPHDGLIWLPSQGSDFKEGIFIARISHLFLEQRENLLNFVNKIGPLISEIKVIPPD